MTLSRRQFLHGASVLGAVTALGACSGSRSGKDAAGTSTSTTTTTRSVAGGTLVIVTLTGGNDALNTVAPVSDGVYRSLRGALALDPAATHDVGEGFALHPALAGCKALWDDDRLAIVHGVGFDTLDRSHFHCMDVWQAGREDDISTGWIGRWLDLAGTDPLDVVAIGQRLPLLVRGAERTGAVVPVGPFELPGDDALRALLTTMSKGDPNLSPLARAAARTTADLLAVVDRVSPVLTGDADDEGLVAQLDTVAALIEADLPTRVYAVELGGFDTHAAQAATHDQLLGEVDAALTSFLDRIGDRPVTVAVYSEFGRRVVPNGSDGTDHGRAGTVLLAGNVLPGHHGDPPPLNRLDDGDLSTTIQFGAVFGGLLEGVLDIEATDVVGPGVKPLQLV